MEKAAEPKIPQEFILDAFADPTSVRDVVRGTSWPLVRKLPAPSSLGLVFYAHMLPLEGPV